MGSEALMFILIGLSVTVSGILILRIGRKVAIFLLALGILGIIGTTIFALAEQARASRQIAQAATVAVAGQAAGSAMVVVLAILLVIAVLVALAAMGYLSFRLKRAEMRLEKSRSPRWLPGPNAQWQREGEPGIDTPQGLPQQALSQLLILEILRHLRDLQKRPPAYRDAALLDQDDVYALSSGNADDDDYDLPPWGWDEDW